MLLIYNDSLFGIGQFTVGFTVGPTACNTARKIREIVVFPFAKKVTCSGP